MDIRIAKNIRSSLKIGESGVARNFEARQEDKIGQYLDGLGRFW